MIDSALPSGGIGPALNRFVKQARPFRIGQAARAAGVTTDTIRYYEREKLLPRPERTSGGYRVYGTAEVDRLKFIRKAQRMGFSLEQIRAILRERDRGNAPCDSVIRMTRQRLAEVEDEIKQLQSTRRSLKRYLAEWDGDQPDCCAAEEFCSLIARARI